MLLKSKLPFMVECFKNMDVYWYNKWSFFMTWSNLVRIYGWYNGIYYFGRVLANSVVGWMTKTWTIKKNLMYSIYLTIFGVLVFCTGTWETKLLGKLNS